MMVDGPGAAGGAPAIERVGVLGAWRHRPAHAIVGVAGLAFSVSARTREFGVRLAVGSTPVAEAFVRTRFLLPVLNRADNCRA
jgi:hypothetical protein